MIINYLIVFFKLKALIFFSKFVIKFEEIFIIIKIYIFLLL